jgi:hypothetical protein
MLLFVHFAQSFRLFDERLFIVVTQDPAQCAKVNDLLFSGCFHHVEPKFSQIETKRFLN